MSVKVMDMVYERGPRVPGWRFLMLALGDNADDQGYCFPGLALLARKTCASERTVLRTLAAMQAAGWLTVELRAVRPRGAASRIRVNAYQLNMARLRGEEAIVAPGLPVSTFRRCDTVADRQTVDEVTTVSGRGVVDDVTKGVVSTADDVTESTRRCDKPGIAILINRHEPRSKNEPKDNTPQPPLQGGAALGEALPEKRNATATAPGNEDGVPTAVDRVMRECGWTRRRLREGVERQMRLRMATVGEAAEAVADAMIAAWLEYVPRGAEMRFQWGPGSFIEGGHWRDRRGWPVDQAAARKAAEEARMRARATVGMRKPDAGEVWDQHVRAVAAERGELAAEGVDEERRPASTAAIASGGAGLARSTEAVDVAGMLARLGRSMAMGGSA